MSKQNYLGALTLSAAMLSSCSTISSINPFSGGNDEDESADKSGRIEMVSAENMIQADPDLIATAVILPDPVSVTSWSQTGGSASKATGHIRAGVDFEVDWRWSGAEGSGTNKALSVAPIAGNGKVYLLDADQEVFAVDANTGKTSWKKQLKSDNKRDGRAFGGGIALHGEELIIASGYGFVVKLDANTGSEIWKVKTEAPMTGSPTISGDRLFIASNNNEFFAMSMENGAIEWTDQAIAESARVLSSPSPAAIEDFVVAPYSSGEVIAYLPSNGRRLWSDSLTRSGRFTPISAINDIASRPVLANGLVFASSQSGVLAAIDGRSGSRVWSVPLGSTQAPAVSGEFLFAVSVDAQLVCVEAVSGKVVWVQDLPRYRDLKDKKGRISYSGPIIASNRVVLTSSDGQALAFSPQSGEKLEELDLVRIGRFGSDAGFFLEPIAYEERILLLADNGTLFSIR